MNTTEQIAARMPSYDPAALRADAVGAFLEQLVAPVNGFEVVPLLDALGRVLSQDVVSPINVPPHDNSAMDGYAFAGAELVAGQRLSLRVVGTALAGKAWTAPVQHGECVKIMTGAVMPAGLDTVVPHELTKVHDDGPRDNSDNSGNSDNKFDNNADNNAEHNAVGQGLTCISIAADEVRPGANRRFAGEDLMAGTVALAQGDMVTPAALGLLASLGLSTVQVYRRLRVAYFSTGDEILSLGDAPREGAVYDSNRYTVFGLLTRLGVQVLDLGSVRDDPALLEAAFRDAARQADAVVTSGGVSAGDADYTRSMMQTLGDVVFWRIAMRPGRPMAVGHITTTKYQAKLASGAYSISADSYKNDSFLRSDSLGGCRAWSVESENRPQRGQFLPDLQPHSRAMGQKDGEKWTAAVDLQPTISKSDSLLESAVLFGLPGNPVAVMVTFLAFVRPALLRMMGSKHPAPALMRAICTEQIRKRPGRTEYQRGVVTSEPGGLPRVRTTGAQGSGMLRSMVLANALIVLGHDQGDVAPGDPVDVMMFEGVI